MSRKHKKSARSQRNKRQAFNLLFNRSDDWYKAKAAALGMTNPEEIVKFDRTIRPRIISKLEILFAWKTKQKELNQFREWLQQQGVEFSV